MKNIRRLTQKHRSGCSLQPDDAFTSGSLKGACGLAVNCPRKIIAGGEASFISAAEAGVPSRVMLRPHVQWHYPPLQRREKRILPYNSQKKSIASLFPSPARLQDIMRAEKFRRSMLTQPCEFQLRGAQVQTGAADLPLPTKQRDFILSSPHHLPKRRSNDRTA